MYTVKQRRYFVGNAGRFLANLTSMASNGGVCFNNSQLFFSHFCRLTFNFFAILSITFSCRTPIFFVVENMALNGLLFSNFSSSLDIFPESCLSESMKFNPRNFSSFLRLQKPILAAENANAVCDACLLPSSPCEY